MQNLYNMGKFKLTQQKYNEKIATIITEAVHMHPELSFMEILELLKINENISSEDLFNKMTVI